MGTASDGHEGSEAIREHRPDIVITDIRMPGLDGLSMLSRIKSEFPEMQITVLTGFRDFAYAQEAIKLGVTRFFLLKPSKIGEIDEALRAMTSNLEQRAVQIRNTAENAAVSVKGDAAGSFTVRRAVEYMEKHYAERICLSEVADKCYDK